MQNEIEKIWNSPELLTEPKYIKIIEEIIEELDTGQKKVVEMQDGTWKVNQWIKQAILLYFRIRKME
ncbi:MAG TPA: 2,3,4,5-tetrahydropyridine-2,6-dicarboxylate N-succinyltransferase, partial [Catalimonadaceae bacterium]|nr:2,3,4,5-tetrahydropyridine-2,6-dicarboxylate N-succinyltransferase [Catalimonadaceae bacterium]